MRLPTRNVQELARKIKLGHSREAAYAEPGMEWGRGQYRREDSEFSVGVPSNSRHILASTARATAMNGEACMAIRVGRRIKC